MRAVEDDEYVRFSMLGLKALDPCQQLLAPLASPPIASVTSLEHSDVQYVEAVHQPEPEALGFDGSLGIAHATRRIVCLSELGCWESDPRLEEKLASAEGARSEAASAS